MPSVYAESRLNTPDSDSFSDSLSVGAPALDGPIVSEGKPAWWLGRLDGSFTIALFCLAALPDPALLLDLAGLQAHPLGVKLVLVVGAGLAGKTPDGLASVIDKDAILAARYDAQDGACYLIRPDQHIAARWRKPDKQRTLSALLQAAGFDRQETP